MCIISLQPTCVEPPVQHAAVSALPATSRPAMQVNPRNQSEPRSLPASVDQAVLSKTHAATHANSHDDKDIKTHCRLVNTVPHDPFGVQAGRHASRKLSNHVSGRWRMGHAVPRDCNTSMHNCTEWQALAAAALEVVLVNGGVQVPLVHQELQGGLELQGTST